MWRGNRGNATSKSEAAGKDRGCVIACINMLGLDNNNELYRSHIELKRKMVELCIQAVLADMKEPNANTTEVCLQFTKSQLFVYIFNYQQLFVYLFSYIGYDNG